jgi:S1-C subfamily serine protease
MTFSFEKIKSILFYLSLVMILLSNKNIFLSKIDNFETKDFVEKRTTLISWKNETWSGFIFQRNENNFQILTILHEETWKKLSQSKDAEFSVFTEFGEEYTAKLDSWDSCSEVALLTIEDDQTEEIIKPPNIIKNDEKLSDRIYSFGHPLGLNLHYTEGYVTSKGNILKSCGMITNGFSGGTIPGQTGSGVWNESGELVGLIVAASAYQAEVYSVPSFDRIGISKIPVTFLGRYIRASEISSFLEKKDSKSLL